MNRQQVSSSNIASVGYDPASSTLEVEFHNHQDRRRSGPVYQYYGVPAEVHQRMMRSESVGRYFKNQIERVYPYAKVSG